MVPLIIVNEACMESNTIFSGRGKGERYISFQKVREGIIFSWRARLTLF
jgi:hypothetical protein